MTHKNNILEHISICYGICVTQQLHKHYRINTSPCFQDRKACVKTRSFYDMRGMIRPVLRALPIMARGWKVAQRHFGQAGDKLLICFGQVMAPRSTDCCCDLHQTILLSCSNLSMSSFAMTGTEIDLQKDLTTALKTLWTMISSDNNHLARNQT